MKKGISQNKVQRMRNIISGKYNAKSKISSGYNKKIVEHKEGDVWEEKGKKWTIKNGIKRTINKLDFARKINRIPLKCPKCDIKLNHPAHKKMFRRWGMCLTCTTKWEYEMKANGTYDEWFKDFDTKNFNAFIENVTVQYNEWLSSRDSNHYITESGQIEDWSGGQTTEELQKEFNDSLEEVKEKRNAKAD